MSDHQGLLKRRPLLAMPLAFALLALAGLPPAVVGLVAKIVVLRPVAGEGMWWLAVVAALNVALGIAVYLRWIVVIATRPARVDALTEAARAASDDDAAATSGAVPAASAVLIVLLTAALVGTSIVPVGIF